MAELQSTMPPGWDCQLDRKTGRYYFVNHYTKTTTWEDPRHPIRPRNSVEHIAMQHGSPEFRRNYVYPSQTTPIPAFQIPAHYSPKSVPLQELNSSVRSSPRSIHVQDSSLSNTEEAVTKIGAMFPTVSDTHIRILMKKYHNREALVISALQVEKHPITTPGPFATPPPARNIHPLITPPLGLRFASRGGSPVLRTSSNNSPKPHSPKLKLRYMKSIFPKADETIILDVLSNNENNIQKASEILKEMGYEKRDNKLPQRSFKKEPVKVQELPKPVSPPKVITSDDKKLLQAKLEEKYKDIPSQVVTIALESVDYDEDRAKQILQIMVEEEKDKLVQNQNTLSSDEVVAASLSSVPLSQSRQSLKSLLKTEKSDNSLKESTSFCRVIEESIDMANGNEYRSSNIINTKGANRNIVKGANQELLLEDYVKWHGPQPSVTNGSQIGLAKGPNQSLLTVRDYQAHGANSELRKGPKLGLAKGSIFSQLRGVVGGESRGK